MTRFDVDPADVADGEGRFERAAADFVGSRIEDPGSAAFTEAFDALWDYFGAKNEIERRPVLEEWLRRPTDEGSIRLEYHLLAWRARDGALAAVRDCFVGVDRERRECVVLLSHGLVLPPFRRTGVAALVRTAPATLARRALAAEGLDPRGTPTVLVAEMEPVVPSDEASIVRLLSYGRTGFGVVPPAVLPYCQPDFRVLASAEEAEPIPMPCVVRVLDREPERAIGTSLADALVVHLALIHDRACEPVHVRRLAEADRRALRAYGRDEIPLLVLPTAPAELDRLEPLLRSRALRHYPERYRRDLPDPDADLAALRAAAERLGDR